MKTLIVAATYSEIAPLFKKYPGIHKINDYFFSFRYINNEINILITGVGMTSTAFHLGTTLSKTKYDYAFNFGIAGTFNKLLKTGTVVNVSTEIISELGAENGNSFLKFNELRMSEQTLERTVFMIENKNEPQIPTLAKLTRAKGITVNTVHGNKSSIEKTIRLFSPDVETMEGAAFLFACNHEKVQCAQIRSISNYVEERNIETWDTALAIKNHNEVASEIINSL